MLSVKNRIINEFRNEPREVIDWTLYDSLLLSTASAVNNLTFFQNTVGTVGRARTNMQNAGLLPSPEQMIIEEIWCFFVNSDGVAFQFDRDNNDTPINVFLSKGWWDFEVEPAIMYQGHLSELVTPAEEIVFDCLTGDAAADQTLPFADTAIYAKLYLREPIVLGSTRHFELRTTLTTPAAGDGYSITTTLMYWFLKGQKRRNK